MREYHVFSAMAQASEAPRNLGRRISRRLSMSVAKVPTFIQSRFSRTDADVVDFNTNGGGGGGTGQSSTSGAGSLVSHNGLKWPQQLRRSRPVTVHIILPNGIERTITCPGKSSVRQAVQTVALELHICDFRLRMSDTLAVVSPSAEASLLDGDIVLLEDTTRVRDERGETDGRFRLTEDLLEAEREFLVNLRTIHDVYERPLRKLCSISDEEKRLLFGGVEPILSVSNMLLTKLADALSSWDPHETKIGSLFSKQFWNQFDEYYRFFTQAKELLKEKQSRDDEFAEICKLRQGAALHTIDSLLDLPIQRLASYERYFQDLLSETAADHPDLDEVHKARDKARELLKRCEEEINQLDRVQNLFPNDQLYLHDKDAVSLKMKGLIRKRSTTAARLQRAFSAKSLRTTPATPLAAASSNGSCEVDASCSSSSPSSSAGASMTVTPCSHGQSATPCAGSSESSSSPRNEKRQFIMETPVLFINGLQSRDRHLFLFNDLLLIAKARSGGHFKLKDKVRISELWLATCVDEVAEGSAGKSRDTSFVIGWPPSVNLVATFNTAALRDLWWNRLGQAVKEERDKEPKATTIQITYHDAVQAIEYFKTLSVGPTETVRDVIKLALSHLEMSNTVDSNQFRLWLKTGSASPPLSSVDVGDSSPYPLIGHEFPFAIKMNCLRDYISRTAAEGATENDNAAAAAAANGLDMLDHCNNIYSADPATRCQFILKSVQKPNFGSGVLAGGAKQTVAAKGSGASGGKTKKSPTRIQKVFRRVQSKPDSIDTVGAPTGPSSLASIAPLGAIFAQPLSKICPQPDQLPQPVLDMLLELRAKGPHTVGIFRKSANARQVREIREHIDSATSRMDWSGVNAVVTAVVFKDFLRSLPDSLLCSSMYDQWLQVAAMDCHDGALEKIKGLCDRLPSANVTLLRHFLCVLVHITASSSHNMMSASNLAVCVGPSLLWAPQLTALPSASSSGSSSALNSALALSAEATASKQVPALVAVLIDKCAHLFGADTLNLLNDKAPTVGISPAIGEVQQQQQTQQLNNNRRISLGSTPSGIGYSRTSKAPVQKHMARHGLMQHDSGNEESDSLHSLYHSDVMRRDDSSIDSLERELMNDEHHHHHHHVHSTSMHSHLRRDKMSVTNLSRDSGLTLSDTQLYTPDEDMEEGSESSSSGRGSDRDKSGANGGGSASSAEMLLRPRTTTAPAAVSGGSSSAASRSEQSRSMYTVPNISGMQSAPRLDAYGKLNAGPSSYTPVYNRPEAIYRKLSDDVVYAVPKATPTVVLSEEFQSASSRFQRQDWFRRKSHNRKQSGGVKFDDSPSLGGGGPMRRSASDESLANVNSSSMQDGHYHHHMHQHMHYQSNNKKPAAHRKGRAPPPPATGRMMMMDCMELSRRSKSDAHLDADALRLASQDETDRRSSVVNYSKNHHSTEQSYVSSGHNYHQNHVPLHRHQQQHQHSSMRPSLSTPHISEDPSVSSSSTTLADRSYDSSTLSDDDSTPHVSRSNSRGSKDYRAVNSAWESAYGALTVPVPAPIHIIVSQDGTGSIVYPNGSTTTPNAKHPSSGRQMNNSNRSNATSSQYNTPNSVGRTSHNSVTPSSGGRYADYDTVIYSSNGRNRSRIEQRFDESPCTSLNSSKNGTPDIPSYEEAMLIRRQRQGGSATGSQTTTPASASSTTWTTWKDKSSDRNLIQVRASPIRLNGQQKSADENRWDDNGVISAHPSPSVPVKSDLIPPLPPKQKIHLRSNPVRLRLNNNNTTNINNNSSMSPSTRARPVTIHMDASILSSLDSSSPQQPQQQAPALPRKERRGNNVSVVSIENSYTPLHRSFAFSTHNLRTAMMENAGREESSSTSSWTSRDDREDDERKDQEIQTSGQWAQFCEIETQTSLSPQPSLTPSASSADDEALTAPTSKRAPIVGRYEKNHVKSAARRREVAVETERSRARTREVLTGKEHRSHSLPPLERSPLASEAEDVESDEHERNESVKGKTKTTITATKLESPTSQTPRRAEISWSVSQLRALFNGNSPVSSSSSTTTTPPPYRLPPTHQQPQQQQRQRSESTDSYGEESYV